MTLGLVNATNARDLGGLVTADGRRVRSGLVFRANALNRLTDDDVEAVAKLGLACVVDLRSEREVEMVGPDRLPTPPPARLVALPLSDANNGAFAAVAVILKGETSDLLDAGAALDSDLLAREMVRVYRWLATSEPGRAGVATVLRMMAEPDGLPLLFHCTAGKDRTGWLAAVLLSILGVDRDTIMADYLRTNELSGTSVDFIVGRLEGKVPNPSAVLPMIQARPEYLLEAFAAVEEDYGDLPTYLRTGLALEESTVDTLRTVLLD
jgi:protein-tyrosine phosphatase